MSHDWCAAAKIITNAVAQSSARGIKGRAALAEREIRDALQTFGAELEVHDYLVCRIVRGDVPSPGDDDKKYAAVLRRLANKDVDTWDAGIRSGLILTVPLSITLSLIQRARRDLSKNGVPYRRHEMMTSPLYEQAAEQECCVLYGEQPIYPYTIRTGKANYVVVDGTVDNISGWTMKNSHWRCGKQFWLPVQLDPAQAVVNRQTVIADAVRVLVPLRNSISQLLLEWPTMLAELQSVVFQIESASIAIDDLRAVKDARPTINKVRTLLDEAVIALGALRHKPASGNFASEFRAISAAICAARPAVRNLEKVALNPTRAS